MPLERCLPSAKNLLRLMGLYLMPVRLKLFVSDTLQPRYPPTSHFAVNTSLWLIQLFILEILYSTICLTNWTVNQNRWHSFTRLTLFYFNFMGVIQQQKWNYSKPTAFHCTAAHCEGSMPITSMLLMFHSIM